MQSSLAVLPLATPQALRRMERSELASLASRQHSLYIENARRLIVEHNRIDLLMRLLGYDVRPYHLAMLRWQFMHPENLQLVFRGAGKSTACTVVKAIHLIAKNRNIRILIASKSATNAEGFLKEIKGHIEGDFLAELFGPFYDANKVPKWDTKEIEVLGRTTRAKESTITCVGAEGTIVSKHYDVILSDDLVDENNSRTPHMRAKTRTWFFKTLLPCLEPPDSRVPHRGEHHMEGTRYHFDDLYNTLMEGSLKDHVHRILPYDDQGRTVWPEKFTMAWFRKIKEGSGTIIFNSQYLNDVEAMKGEVFDYDDCPRVTLEEIPRQLDYYMGVDLAIKLTEKNDYFAIVVVGRSGKEYYVVDAFFDRLRVGQQTKKIIEYWKKWKPVNIGIETNAYQEAQKQLVEDAAEERNLVDLSVTGFVTSQDKLTKAWRLSPTMEEGLVRFLMDSPAERVIDQVVAMPHGDHDDLFDALFLAVLASRKRRRRKERSKVGVL